MKTLIVSLLLTSCAHMDKKDIVHSAVGGSIAASILLIFCQGQDRTGVSYTLSEDCGGPKQKKDK